MIYYLINNPKKTLFLLFSLTIYFGYYAFFSSHKLIVDFSLEQMFPENDIERDKYEAFREEFSREDVSAGVQEFLEKGILSYLRDIIKKHRI